MDRQEARRKKQQEKEEKKKAKEEKEKAEQEAKERRGKGTAEANEEHAEGGEKEDKAKPIIGPEPDDDLGIKEPEKEPIKAKRNAELQQKLYLEDEIPALERESSGLKHLRRRRIQKHP